ncbi:hypothetical protein [Nitrincola tapanii]|uniref:Uncharacterized protein n=1 Tax=Nitrincola tapanii TaxID=1708751 RepID=A0A5A9W5N0_9GAMM|nr:hypothetical protein [Nitrincola tapanii]KAA0875754.1 hypothetical protein E1H14_03440 [Nitrincola tapanii]
MTSLDQAINALAIREVRLRNSSLSLADDIELLELQSLNLEVQAFHGVGKIKEIRLQEDGQNWWEYNFFYAAGVRLVQPEIESSPVVEIQATLNALYRSSVELERFALDAFSEEHVGYHVWPYWREYVQSTCARLGITPIRVGLYRVNQK